MPLNRLSKPEAAGNSLLDNPEAAGNNQAGSKPEVARNRVVATHSSTGRQSRPRRQGQRETHLQNHRTHVQNLLVQSHDEILHLRRGSSPSAATMCGSQIGRSPTAPLRREPR